MQNRRVAHVLTPSMHRLYGNRVTLGFPGDTARHWKVAHSALALVIPNGARVAEQDRTGASHSRSLILRSHDLLVVSSGHVAVQSRLAGWIEPTNQEDAISPENTVPRSVYVPNDHLMAEEEALKVTSRSVKMGQAVLSPSVVYAALTELCWAPLPEVMY